MTPFNDFLFILTQDLQSPSGLGRYLPWARALVQAGYQVKIIALHSDFTSLVEKKIHLDGILIHYVAPMHVLKTGSRKIYYSPFHLIRILLQAVFFLTKEALGSPARWVVIGKPHPMNGLAGLACKWFTRSTLLVDCDDYEAGSGNFQSSLQRKVVAFFEKSLPRLAKIVTTNTHFMRDNLVRWGIPAEKIYYLPNGIDEQRFAENQPENELKVLRANLNLEDKPVVVYVGSFSLASHPVLLLLDAFERVLEQVPETILLMVGGGEDFERVVQMAHTRPVLSERVIFSGRVAPIKTPQYYRLAQVSVDPVVDEAAVRGRCPLKMFESWATGVPFVTSDVGDRKLLSGDPPAALLAHPGDPTSLADMITRVLTNDHLAKELRTRGRLQAPLFYWTRLAKGFADFVDPKRKTG